MAPLISPSSSHIQARREALRQSEARYERLREVHRMLAQDIGQMDEPARTVLIERALACIQVWEDSGIASPYYIHTWRRILARPVTRIPRMLSGRNANALVQNSPFGFAFSRPKYREVLNLAPAQD